MGAASTMFPSTYLGVVGVEGGDRSILMGTDKGDRAGWLEAECRKNQENTLPRSIHEIAPLILKGMS